MVIAISQKYAPYGLWESPITAHAVAEDSVSMSDKIVDPVTKYIYYIEQRASEGGRYNKPSSAEKIRHRIAAPHTSRISKSTTQMSGLNVSRITDLSTNPTDDLSQKTAEWLKSLTTQQSSKSNRSTAMRKKNKKQRSQKPLANLDNSNPKELWLDLSFLNRQCTEKDYLCNYWRNTVADEQTMRLGYFLDVLDAHEREFK
ncbi:hypothetical protein P692DRAFT_20871026 [Suillus brevipes Sb2]|nr:hypothetical protein P692DRAFT_20871026 [Suillus brevipes Sb2]